MALMQVRTGTSVQIDSLPYSAHASSPMQTLRRPRIALSVPFVHAVIR